MPLTRRTFFFLFPFLTLVLLGPVAFAADIYFCPMKCEGEKTYPTKGSCPVCGMNLEKKGEGDRALNTRDYRMDLATVPSTLVAGQKGTLVLTPRRTKDNSVVKDLEIHHEKLLHLIMVSQDLSWFAHEHPELQPDGSLKIDFTFPRGGNYVLYADLTPKGDRNQVFPLALKIDGEAPPSVSLKDNWKTPRKLADGYSVTLHLTPGPVAEVPVTLSYKIQRKGKDVKDLQPYLGSLGHSLTISEDTTQYLHAHPLGGHNHGEHHAHPVTAGNGPKVDVMTTFPRAGMYKTWIQFQHAGKVLTADFAIKVTDKK